VKEEKRIRHRRMHVTLDAFNQVMFAEDANGQEKVRCMGASSKDIEKRAMDGLRGVTALLASGINGQNAAGHGAGA